MYDLKELKIIANLAVEEAQTRRQDFANDPINWADLRCSSAEYVIADDDSFYYQVCIEEASPDCRKLREFISERIEAAGFQDVEVCTEW